MNLHHKRAIFVIRYSFLQNASTQKNQSWFVFFFDSHAHTRTKVKWHILNAAATVAAAIAAAAQ